MTEFRRTFISKSNSELVPCLLKYIKRTRISEPKLSNGKNPPGGFQLPLNSKEAEILYAFTYKIVCEQLPLNATMYEQNIDPSTGKSTEDPICPICFQKPETWKHFLKCSANINQI